MIAHYYSVECDAYGCDEEYQGSDRKVETRRWAREAGWTELDNGRTFCPRHKEAYVGDRQQVKISYNGDASGGKWRVVDLESHVVASGFENVNGAFDWAEAHGYQVTGRWSFYTSAEGRTLAARRFQP